MHFHIFKCKLERHPEDSVLRKLKGGPIRIDPLATVQVRMNWGFDCDLIIYELPSVSPLIQTPLGCWALFGCKGCVSVHQGLYGLYWIVVLFACSEWCTSASSCVSLQYTQYMTVHAQIVSLLLFFRSRPEALKTMSKCWFDYDSDMRWSLNSHLFLCCSDIAVAQRLVS